MATVFDRYIGTNGDILIPTDKEEVYSPLLSVKKGVYYIPQTHEVVAIEQGNPIGLLLTLTYPATP
jgi:hypothetical protein